jgi:outer membrane protein assembly factor BamB
VPDAQLGIGRASVLRWISGTPDWPRGVEAIEQFARDYSELPGFDEQKINLRQWGREAALGAANDAIRLRRRDLIETSRQALKLVQRYSPVDDQPKELESRLEKLWISATDAADRQQAHDAAVAGMKAALAAAPPDTMRALGERRALLLQFPELEGDSAVQKLLAETLDVERRSIRGDDIDPDQNALNLKPSTDDPLAAVPGVIALTEHTRTRAGEQSDDSTVYVVGKGVCYGIDTVTGDPLWRRPLGRQLSFFPQPVPTAVPGLLAFNSLRGELILLDRRGGSIQWRLPLDEPSVERPLVDAGRIYLPTPAGRLYKIDLESGRVIGRLQFAQPLIGPPVRTRGGADIVAIGRRELLYTVAPTEFEAVAVAYTGHAAGSLGAPPKSNVDAPAMGMGELLLLAENQPGLKCLLRVFDLSRPREGIPQRAAERVAGHVRDEPLLRGNLLFVPSGEDLVTVFAVSDDPDQPPLTKLAAQNVPDGGGPTFLSAAASDELWLAGGGLFKLQLSSGALNVKEGVSADGVAAQPLQEMGDVLYLGRHRPYSTSVLFTMYNMDTLTSNWGVTVGSTIVATAAQNDVLAALNEDGRMFRLSAPDLQASEAARFNTAPTVRLRLPDGLNSPLLAAPVGAGSIAVAVGGAEPACWIVTAGGQVAQTVPLDDPVEAEPAPLADGAVLPLPNNRLRFVALRPGAPPVDDYKPKIDAGAAAAPPAARWVHVEGVDAAHVLALDGDGNLIQVQYREQPSRHLYGVRSVKLDAPAVMPFAVHDGLAVVADVARRLHVYDAATLQPFGEADLGDDATSRVWADGGRAFVETSGGTLQCYQLKPELKKLWSLPADRKTGDFGIAGAPLTEGNRLLIARRNGQLTVVNPQTGEVLDQKDLAQPIDSGPRRAAGGLFVITFDGGLLRIDSLVAK